MPDSVNPCRLFPEENPPAGANPPRAQPPRQLSKSKLLAYRQCERRLWLEVHMPSWRDDSAESRARFDAGNRVGEIARQSFDPDGRGALIDVQAEGFTAAFERTVSLLSSDQAIFEAGFSTARALSFADVMLPVEVEGRRMWRMIEVKSATGVKDYHRDDAAIQAYLARSAGVPLASISIAHVDSKWVYPGGGDYRGLLKESDVTVDAFGRDAEVQSWIDEAHAVVREPNEPQRRMGSHCTSPFPCGFATICRVDEPWIEYPVAWLPRAQAKALKTHLAEPDVTDMRQVPDDLLNARQLRVKAQTLANTAWFDRSAAAQALQAHEAPMCFLDFETIQFTVPIWAGTRPYAQVPFQFSLHRLGADGTVDHREFLDLSGDDPSAAFADALVAACNGDGAVFVYNAGFENARMKELALRFPQHGPGLRAIAARVVDLLPIAQAHYYHPSQQGSWSIKKVLPAVVPELSYDDLDGVQDGTAAMNAYLEAINPATPSHRKSEIRDQLLAYCSLDTYAMVRLWQVFGDRRDLDL